MCQLLAVDSVLLQKYSDLAFDDTADVPHQWGMIC
jgi:hypothetical protein